MAWPPPVVDDFTGPDGSINGRKVSAGGYTWVAPWFGGNNAGTIATNRLAGNDTSEREGALTRPVGPDVQVAVTIPTGTFVSGGAGDATNRLFARIQGTPPITSATYYDLQTNVGGGAGDDELRLRRSIANSGAILLDVPIGADWAAGDSFGMELTEEGGGTRIRVYYKASAGSWVEVDDVLDVTPGRPGAGLVGCAMYIPSLTFTMDDFRMEDLSLVGYKRLFGPAQLTTSAADIYTAPPSKIVRLRHIYANNPTGSPVDFTMSIGTDAAATRLYDSYNIPAGGSLEWAYDHALVAGEKIQAYAGTSSALVLTVDAYVEPMGG